MVAPQRLANTFCMFTAKHIVQEVEVSELVESAIEASDAGDPQAALRLLLDARRLSPKDPFLLMRLGVLLGRMGEADKALVALDQAYSIEHNDAQVSLPAHPAQMLERCS